VNLEQGFLQAILENPDDDTSRLVYADWLEETGGPAEAARAEFIRTQVALASLPLGGERRLLLEARERALLREHAVTWRRALPQLDGIQWGDFVRGFIGAIWASVTTVRDQAAVLFAAQPIVQLWLGSLHDGDFAVLAESPWLSRIHAIGFREGMFHGARLRPLAETPHGNGLRSLYLLEAAGTVESATLLLRSPRLTAFGDLHVCYCHWDRNQIATLAACASLTRLTNLDLSYNSLDDESVAILAASPHVANLRYLNLSNNSIGWQGARALAHSLHLRELTCLDIANNRLDTDSVQTLREGFPLVRA
jgi:uncharacterized protein (TIGR02996 family)